MPRLRMAGITNLLVGSRSAELAGIAPGSKTGSIAVISFIVTTVSVQGINTQIKDYLDLLEKAHLAVKNTCTRMSSSRTMTEDDLDSFLRVPLIYQFMRPIQ